MINKKIEKCWACVCKTVMNLSDNYSDTVFSNKLNSIDLVCLLSMIGLVYSFGNINLEKAEKIVKYIEKTLNTDEYLGKKLDQHDFIMAFIGRVMKYYSIYIDAGGSDYSDDYDKSRFDEKMLDTLSNSYLREIRYIDPENVVTKHYITILCERIINEIDKTLELDKMAEADDYNEALINNMENHLKPQFNNIIDSYLNGYTNEEGNLAFQFSNTDEFIKYSQIISDTNTPHRNDVKSVVWENGDKYFNMYQKAFDLFNQKMHRQAIHELERALILNPIGLDARFEIVTNYIVLDELQNAKKTLYNMKDLLVTNSNVARFYRAYGAAFTKEEKYNVAYACYFYSKQFELSEIATNEILYLSINFKIDKFLMKCYTSFDYNGVIDILENNSVPIIHKKEPSFDEINGTKRNETTQKVDLEEFDKELFTSNKKNDSNRH